MPFYLGQVFNELDKLIIRPKFFFKMPKTSFFNVTICKIIFLFVYIYKHDT